MRRMGLPEKYLRLRSNCKNGSWTMVATAWGPTQEDWEAIGCVTENGINALRPVDPDSSATFGYHAWNGTTQGGRSGPDDFKAYYDVLAQLLRSTVEDPAWRLDEHGERTEDIGNAFMDDAATSTRSQKGAVVVLETSGDFFERRGEERT